MPRETNTDRINRALELLASQEKQLEFLDRRVDAHDNLEKELARLATDHELLKQEFQTLKASLVKWERRVWMLLAGVVLAVVGVVAQILAN